MILPSQGTDSEDRLISLDHKDLLESVSAAIPHPVVIPHPCHTHLLYPCLRPLTWAVLPALGPFADTDGAD